MTMLTSLPCKRSLDVPHGQLRHPDYIFCSLCAPETENVSDVSQDDCVLADVQSMEGEVKDSNASSSSRPRPLRQTKYGRCAVCQLSVGSTAVDLSQWKARW